MTEAEWLACDDPGKMLAFVYGLASGRKLRLFSVACCRGADTSFESYSIELEAVERFADGLLTATECDEALADIHPMVAIFISADRLLEAATSAEDWKSACDGASRAGIAAQSQNRLLWSYTAPRYSASIRELFGNPFRPVPIDPAWRTSTALSLAQAAYDERQLPAGTLDPDRLAVLADALMDAGCDSEDLLGHLRSPGPHVRGCWALDLILGKE